MTKKVYKTARGLTVDMGQLRLQNEHVRAVGNMGVNARGDRIDAQGNVIDSANQQLKRRIQKQTNVSDGPVYTNQNQPATEAQAKADLVEEDFDGPMDEPLVVAIAETVEVKAESTKEEAGGLAGALARSKATKSETKKS